MSDRERKLNTLARKIVGENPRRNNLSQPSTPGFGIDDDRRDASFRNPMTTLADIIIGAANGAAIRLGVGTDGQVLTADSTNPRGIEWATPSGGGGGSVAVEDDTVEVTAAVSRIDFKAPLTVTEPVADEVEIDIDVGTGAGQVAAGDHNHDADYADISITQYTDEMAQDAVGAMIADTTSINLTYTDATPELKAEIIDSYVQTLIDDTLEDIEGDEVFASPGNWLFRHKWGEIFSTPNSGTMSSYGYTAGAGTSQGTAAAADDNDGNWAQFTTLASVGQNGGKNNSLQQYRADWHLSYGSLIKTGPDITSVRYIMGMANSGGNVNASDTPAAHGAWFRFSTGVPDTNWICVTGDGTNRTETDSGVAVTADTRYTFRIHFGTVKAKFYIDDVLVATHTTNMPASGTGLGYWATLTTLAASARVIKLNRIWIASIY